MNLALELPSVKQLNQAPERAILHSLAVCAHCAELTLLREFPQTHIDDDIAPVPCRLAANLLLRTLAQLRDAIVLYDTAVVASEHLANCEQDLPF